MFKNYTGLEKIFIEKRIIKSMQNRFKNTANLDDRTYKLLLYLLTLITTWQIL